MRKIIIGYDGSPQADDALALGAVLAEAIGATPMLVAIVPAPRNLLGRRELDQYAAAETRPMLEAAADRLAGLTPVTRSLVARSVAEELSTLAEAERASAIVVGSAHHGAVGRLVLGSVGDSLIHSAPCAVSVAPLGLAACDSRLSSIGVAFDGSPEAWAALETGTGLAERVHSRLTVVTVAEPSNYGVGATGMVFAAAELIDAEKREKQRMLELALSRSPVELPVEGRLISGSAGRRLAELSADFDLMVLGSRGHGPLGRTVLGSVSSELIHSARSAVLVLPRGVSVDPLGVADRRIESAGAALARAAPPS